MKTKWIFFKKKYFLEGKNIVLKYCSADLMWCEVLFWTVKIWNSLIRQRKQKLKLSLAFLDIFVHKLDTSYRGRCAWLIKVVRPLTEAERKEIAEFAQKDIITPTLVLSFSDFII